MEIKKKVNEVKEKAKNWVEENKSTIKVIGLISISSLIIGYLRGRHDECSAMGGLKDIWLSMPHEVDYDVCVIKPDLSGLDYPWYFMRARDDKEMFDEKYGANQIE